MILSRVADGLYWMGRYLERAENTARLLLVTEELSTEVLGLDEALAREEWKDLRAVFPGFPEDDRDPRALTGFAAASLLGLSVDPDNPYSVFHSLKKARDNARSVREALTLEVFINLNETYRELEAQNPGQLADPAAFRSALTSTQRGIMSTVGAIEHTLTRDNVRRDESYDKVIDLVRDVVRDQLRPRLAARLEELATAACGPGDAAEGPCDQRARAGDLARAVQLHAERIRRHERTAGIRKRRRAGNRIALAGHFGDAR